MKAKLYTILLFLLLAGLALVITGCAQAEPLPAEAPEEEVEVEEQVEAEEPSQPAEEITITLWHVYGPEMAGANEWFNEAITAFEEEYPNITIEQEITPNDQYKVKLKTAIAAGEAADAFMVYAGGWTEPYAKDGALLEIDKYLDEDNWRNDWISGGLDMLSWDGKTYGVTGALRTTHFWYNKEVFEKYNLEPPETWDEFTTVVETLKENGVTPLAMGNKERWQGDFYAIYLFSRLGGWDAWDSAINRKGDGWADPSMVKALEMLQELVKMEAFTEGTNGVGAMDVNNSFFTGEAAMILNGTFFLDQVKSLAPEGFYENNLGYFNFPVIEDGKGSIQDFQGSTAFAFVVNSQTEHPDEVMSFYRFLFAPENMKELCSKTGWVSTVKGTIPDDADQLTLSIASDAENMTHLYPFADSAMVPALFEIFADAVQATIGLDITPQEAVEMLEEAATKEVGPLQ